MRFWTRAILYITITFVVLFGILFLLSLKEKPEEITYGVSFNTLYAEELHLDWKKVYLAILDDLKVRHLRLSSHWTMVEPKQDIFNFSELDFQISEAEKRDADVILGVGRRLPRWPECHVPEWAKDMPWEEQKLEIKDLLIDNNYD